MARPEWTPDVVITPGMVARTVAEQFPELAGLPVEHFAVGWDNVLFRVGADLVFRFVHREVAVPGARREATALRGLPTTLPLPVPRPVHLGTPTAELPWPFWGGPLIAGTELAAAGLPDDRRTALARDLGAFLAALHGPDVTARVLRRAARTGVTFPVDPMRRGDPGSLAARARVRVETLVGSGLWEPDPRVTAVLDEAADVGPSREEPVVVHGDLHVRHVLVGPDERVSGVIDWGDTCLADPAIDLSTVYAGLAGPARAAFFDAYGEIGPARERVARVLAVHHSAVLAHYGQVEGMTALRDEALRGLTRAVT